MAWIGRLARDRREEPDVVAIALAVVDDRKNLFFERKAPLHLHRSQGVGLEHFHEEADLRSEVMDESGLR